MNDAEFANLVDAVGRPPLYQDSKIAIFNADCRDILPTLPFQCADLVLADPPYNVGVDYDASFDSLPPDDYEEWILSWHHLLRRKAKVTVITPGAANLPMWIRGIEEPDWIMSWVKPNANSFNYIGKTRGGRLWEPIFVYGKADGCIPVDTIVIPIAPIDEADKHPCPKPIRLWQWIIRYFTEENELVIDPFLGSGTTAVVARKLGRYCIGIDVSEAYCQIAVDRLQQTVLPFAAAPVEKQANLSSVTRE